MMIYSGSVDESVLVTRVTPPRLPSFWLERTQVTEHMNHGLATTSATRLIALCAPPGFGKSTALAAAAARVDQGFAYIRVDTTENDPVRFWSYVAASFARNCPPLGKRSRALLANAAVAGAIGGTKDAVQTPFLTSLLNEIADYQASVVLAVDDYHRIESGEVHEAFSAFVVELPPNARAVVASRTEPPLRLSALRARGELVEIDVSSLSFSESETSEYLRAHVWAAQRGVQVRSSASTASSKGGRRDCTWPPSAWKAMRRLSDS